jgi:hypothetical protein
MDYIVLRAGRCQNLREIFPESISDETILFGKEERQANEMTLGFWHSGDSVKVFGTVLAQSGQKRRMGVAIKLESALESIVHFMSGRSAAW